MVNAGPPVVSIAIVTYNATDYVRKCLDSLRAMTRVSYEVLVVDNASRPDTRAYLQQVDGIRLHLNSDNRLWCPASNQALAAAHPASRYFMLLNPDVEILRKDWLERLIAVIELHPRIAITGTKHNYRPLGPTFGAIDGVCLLMRREVYEDPAIGPLDERLPWNGSPYVLTARAWAKGWIYRAHPPRPRLIRHYGGRSRAEAGRPVPNWAINPPQILREAGLNPWLVRGTLSALRRNLIRLGYHPRLPHG